MALNEIVNKLLSDLRRGFQTRQKAIDSQPDTKTFDIMNNRKLRLAELLDFNCTRLSIQLQRAFLLLSNQQKYDLMYTGIPCTTFDYYLDLPGYVVREKILSFLTNHPQDLLNLLLAIPTEQRFAPLTKEQLEFELGFPEMLFSTEDEEFWEDDNQLRALSLRSDHHLKVILRYFENFLINDISNTERIHGHCMSLPNSILNVTICIAGPYYNDPWIGHVILDMKAMPLQEWNKCPTASKVEIFIGNNGYLREGNPYLAEIQMVGNSIWHVELSICIWGPLSVDLELVRKPSWRNMCKCLWDMPNLRNLHVHHDFKDEGNFEDEDQVGQQIEWIAPLPLPELPFLKSLNFHETKFNNADTFPMLRMLLQKYGGQLNQFGFTVDWPPHGNNIQFPEDLPPCNNLRLLSFTDKSVGDSGYLVPRRSYSRTWQSSGMVLQFMSNFRNVPLKTIKLSLNDSKWLETFYCLLNYLSQNFRNSLEHLELEFGEIEWSPMMRAASSNLLEGLHFPKLVHFGTNLKATPVLYEAVLRYKVLETLEIGKKLWHREKEETKWRKQFTSEVKNNGKKWKIEIWKELPFLKWIGYYKNWWFEEDKITREEVQEIIELENRKMLKFY